MLPLALIDGSKTGTKWSDTVHLRRRKQPPGMSLANLCTDLINLLPTFHINVHNFVRRTFKIVSKIQLTIFGSVSGIGMDHLRRLKQPDSVSLTAPGPDLTNMVSSFHINAHKFVRKSFTFFQFYFLYAFQNWTKSTTAPQPIYGLSSMNPTSPQCSSGSIVPVDFHECSHLRSK